MDMDVKRICSSEVSMLIEEMQNAESLTELTEMLNQAEESLLSLYNACKVKFEGE